MPVERIERIISGTVVGRAAVSPASGKYYCHLIGSNMSPIQFDNLDDVAQFFARKRMAPGFGKIVKNIYIDGFPR